jgi:putative glutathione S-transferase
MGGSMARRCRRDQRCNPLHERYTLADPSDGGRAAVPVLWDEATRTIVNDEAADMVRILERDFGTPADDTIALRPAALEAESERGSLRACAAASTGGVCRQPEGP